MKALILDGSHAKDVQAGNIRKALEGQLPGAEAVVLSLEKKFLWMAKNVHYLINQNRLFG